MAVDMDAVDLATRLEMARGHARRGHRPGVLRVVAGIQGRGRAAVLEVLVRVAHDVWSAPQVALDPATSPAAAFWSGYVTVAVRQGDVTALRALVDDLDEAVLGEVLATLVGMSASSSAPSRSAPAALLERLAYDRHLHPGRPRPTRPVPPDGASGPPVVDGPRDPLPPADVDVRAPAADDRVPPVLSSAAGTPPSPPAARRRGEREH